MLTPYKVDADAIYIHIPFCIKKCEYCDFVSFPSTLSFRKKYVEHLCKELDLYEHPCYDTIYLGGGTPSLLETEELQKILQKLPHNSNTEITLECNPTTLNGKKLKALFGLGINRLSIGIQSTKDIFLKKLGRLHTFEQAKKTYSVAREIGFQNISLDFMFSLPGQSFEDVKEDLETMLELKPEHFSIYSLIWEENTPFFDKLTQGVYQRTENALEAKMYEYIIHQMQEHGYIHYEISNFSKRDYTSRHNQKYWKNEKYLGVGLGAAGYLGNIRYQNYKDVDQYMLTIGKYSLPREEEEILTVQMIEQYTCLLSFRQLQEWIEIPKSYQKICDSLVQKEYLKKNFKGKYHLTQKGLFFFNDMLEYFL